MQCSCFLRFLVNLEIQMITNNLKNAALISYFGITFSIFSGIFYTPWMVSQLGVSDYGIYALVMSVIAFFSLDFGLGLAVSKFLLDYKAKKDIAGAQRFVSTILRLFFYFSCLLLFILLCFYLLIEGIFVELTTTEIENFKTVYLIAGLFSIISMQFRPLDGILIANEQYLFVKLLELGHKVSTLCLIVIALLFDYGLYALVTVNVFIGLVKIFAQYLFVNKSLEENLSFSPVDSTIYPKLFSFSGWVTLSYVAQRSILLVTPFILGVFSGTTQIAIFSIAMVIEGYVWMLSSALGGLFLPRVSNHINTHSSEDQIEKLMIRVGRFQLSVLGLIIIGFISLGHEFIYLWMGTAYLDSYVVVLCLIAHSIITLPQEIAQTTLVASNKVKYRAFGSSISMLICLPISLFLVPFYGAIGAALAILLGNIIGSLLFMNWVYASILKINLLNFFRECHLAFLPALSISFICAIIIQCNFRDITLWSFVLKSLIIITIYVFSIWFFAFNKNEKNIFKNVSVKFNPFIKRVNNV